MDHALELFTHGATFRLAKAAKTFEISLIIIKLRTNVHALAVSQLIELFGEFAFSFSLLRDGLAQLGVESVTTLDEVGKLLHDMLFLLLKELKLKLSIINLRVFKVSQHLECLFFFLQADDIRLDVGILFTKDCNVRGDLLDVEFEVSGKSWDVSLPVPHLVLRSVQVTLSLKHRLASLDNIESIRSDSLRHDVGTGSVDVDLKDLLFLNDGLHVSILLVAEFATEIRKFIRQLRQLFLILFLGLVLLVHDISVLSALLLEVLFDLHVRRVGSFQGDFCVITELIDQLQARDSLSFNFGVLLLHGTKICGEVL